MVSKPFIFGICVEGMSYLYSVSLNRILLNNVTYGGKLFAVYLKDIALFQRYLFICFLLMCIIDYRQLE